MPGFSTNSPPVLNNLQLEYHTWYLWNKGLLQAMNNIMKEGTPGNNYAASYIPGIILFFHINEVCF
jgi:hypothetical protein